MIAGNQGTFLFKFTRMMEENTMSHRVSLQGIACWLACAAFALLPSGCEQPKNPPANATSTTTAQQHNHPDHGEKGPHGGALVAIGGHSTHVEVTLDEDTGKLTAYVLDANAQEEVPIKMDKLEIGFARHAHDEAGKEKPAGGAPDFESITLSAVSPNADGMASRFEGTSEKLKGADDFQATLKAITIGGKNYEQIAFEYPEGNEHLPH